MSKQLVTLLVLALPLAQAVSAAPPARTDSASEAMPQVLRVGSQAEAVPSWVDASRVLNPSGEINADLFHGSSVLTIELMLRQPAVDGCINMGAPIRSKVHMVDETGASMIPSRTTLDEAYRTSELVIEAEVTGRSYGISEFLPGQLLRLVPVKTLKDTLAAQRQYFVFVPIGRFKIGDKTICKVDSSYPDPPAIGDRVVILLQKGFREDSQYLSVPDATGLITLKRNASVSLPEAFRSQASALSSADRLLSHLEGLAKESAQ